MPTLGKIFLISMAVIGLGVAMGAIYFFYIPVIDLKPDAPYQAELGNIINPLPVEQSEPKITLLNIAPDQQDYPLSCEAASLKMALIGKGIYVSEEEIMKKIGYDSTPHRGNIWGNPYFAYVGKINGQICDTGYGVYWPRVAKVAKNWRKAEAFSRWTLQDLTSEIESGNAVIVWGTLPVETLTNCSWYTSAGKYIKAHKETHVRLVVGFVGEAENPLQIIINDPLSGVLYWSADYFLTNWGAFDYSGVVIR